ncbi:hypothetical protein KI387_030054, partial [Taxus chinensis]
PLFSQVKDMEMLINHSGEESDSSEEQQRLDLNKFDEILYYNKDQVLTRVLELGAKLLHEHEEEEKVINPNLGEKSFVLDKDNPFDVGYASTSGQHKATVE